MWKYYCLLLIASLLFSTQFVFTKYYQKTKGAGFFYSLVFGLISSFVAMILFSAVNKFRFEFSLASLALACIYSVVCIVMSAFSVKALSCADLSLYSLSVLLGGLVIPFVYGVFVGETVTPWKIVAVVAVTTSLFVSMKKSGEKKLSAMAVVCIASVFILNGLSSIIVTYHQSRVENAVSSAAFMTLINATRVVISFVVISVVAIRNKIVVGSFDGEKKPYENGEVICKEECAKRKKQTAKSWLIAVAVSVGYGVANGVGNFFVTVSAANVPAVVMYPIVTGGGVFFSSVSGLIFGEKMTVRTVISVVLVLFGTILMMF